MYYKLNGGLLKQIMSILDLNKRIQFKYKYLNKNIVISGIVIKNIGSIKYFNKDLDFSVSDENQYNIKFGIYGRSKKKIGLKYFPFVSYDYIGQKYIHLHFCQLILK